MSATAAPLPWVLVRLKVRLIRNRARSSRDGALRLAITILVAGWSAVIGSVAVLTLAGASDPRVSRAGLVFGATGLLVAWTLLPLLTFGQDETVDPARLVLFPLEPPRLVRGLLVASLVGAAATMAIAVVAVATVSYGTGSALLVAVPAMALLVVLCVTSARTLSTVLATGLSSRRGRDITVIAVSLLALGANGLRFVSFGSVEPDSVDRALAVARWLPPGMLGQAVIDARDGHLLVGFVQLVLPAVVMMWLVRAWGRVLERSLTVVTGGATRARRRRSPAGLPLLFPRLPVVPPTPTGAVAAKELRYLGRDPRRKVGLITAVAVGAVGPIWIGARAGGLGANSVLLATLAGYTAVIAARNQFGYDGAGLWLDVVAGDLARAELVGKNVATALQVLPVVVVIGVALSAFTGGWLYLPAALLLSVAGLGAGLGIANVVSVRLPVRLPDSNNPFSGGNEQGCALTIVILVVTVVQNLAMAPVAVAAVLAAREAPAALVVVAPVSVVYGGLLWWGGLTLAERWLGGHQPELLGAVDPRRTDSRSR